MSLFGKKKESEKNQTCSCSSNQASDAIKSNMASCCCEKSTGEIRSIKVLGSGCKNCHALLEATQKATQELGVSVEVEYITDMQIVMEYGVMSMPALVVNDKVVSMGKVLKSTDVMKIIKAV